MRALLTGGTGFIGSALLHELLLQGWEVVCLSRRPLRCDHPGVSFLEGDLLHPESLRPSGDRLGPIDVIFHLGAAMSAQGKDLTPYLVANGLATVEVLKLGRDLGVRAMVYASGTGLIGAPVEVPITEDHPPRPLHPYHLGKLFGEMASEFLRRTEGWPVTSLRITSPYGPGMPEGTVLSRFAGRALRSEPIEIYGSGLRTQNFVHVSDVVRACLLAAVAPAQGQGIFNIGGPASISMADLARLIIDLTPGTGSRIHPSGKPDPQDDYRWDIDPRRAAAGLGYRPEVALREGLAETLSCFRSGTQRPQWWRPG